MEAIFSQGTWVAWAVLLTAALFYPVWRLIWMMSVNRWSRKSKQAEVPDEVRTRLKHRAAVTAGLLCFVMAFLYTYWLFHRSP
ncbi:MAG: hypothetical protein GVY13_13030 [Alphaproteobacteria bacterium]|jgi:hypothetical protein|nr:hypothetical protein [Alphaproteobacteria bacterium]